MRHDDALTPANGSYVIVAASWEGHSCAYFFSSPSLCPHCLLKGTRIGGALVSEKHANFIVNDEHGSASDVRALAEHVRREVRARQGIELVFEIEFAGDWSAWPPEETA